MTTEELDEILAKPREETIIVFPIGLYEKCTVEEELKKRNLDFEIKKAFSNNDLYLLVFINFNFSQSQILKAAGL